MKKNKFMTRVFSAMENQETEVLDQIQNDLEIAKEDGELDSEEYKITWDPDQEVFVLHDKINDEHTEISEDEEAAFYMTDMTDANEGIPTPEESIPELSVNDEVRWTDELGHEHQGMITMISDGIATILENEVEVAAPIESLMKVEAPVEEVAEVGYSFSEREKSLKEYKVTYKVKNDPTNKSRDRKYTDAVYAADKRSVSSTLREMLKANDPDVKFEIISIEDTGKRSSRFSKVEEPDFSFVEKEFGNSVSDDIPDGISSKLQDIAQTTGCIDYSDIMKMQYTPEKGRKINYLYRVLQEKGELTDKQCQNLKEIVTSVKSFSHIDSPESFREYAHTIMKEAHGDEYSEEVTNKVVDDLLADNPNNDYGELIGRLTSGLGEKKFSQFGVAGFKYSSGRPEVITLFVDAKDKKEAKEMFRSKYPTCGQIKAYNWQDNYDHELLADRYKDGFSAPPAPDELSYSFVEKNFGRWDSEKAAVVLKNPDGTHEVVSIQSEEDEERLKSYKEEGCRVVKRCKNTGEADKYIEEKSLIRAYSFVEKTFSFQSTIESLRKQQLKKHQQVLTLNEKSGLEKDPKKRAALARKIEIANLEMQMIQLKMDHANELDVLNEKIKQLKSRK